MLSKPNKHAYDPKKGPSRKQRVRLFIDVVKYMVDKHGYCAVKARDGELIGVKDMPPKEVAVWLAMKIGCAVKVKPRRWKFIPLML